MERALIRAKRIEEGWCFAELLRKNGEVLLVQAAPTDVANAEECFREALECGRRQDALSWELRSATSPARIYHGRAGPPRRARGWPPSTGGSQKGSRPPIASRCASLVAELLQALECDRRPVAPAGQARRRPCSGDDADRATPITGRQPPAPGTDERIQLEVWRGVVGNMPSILSVE
jgi:hypothetical protein